MAYKVFQNGFPLPASDLNNFLMNQSIITFDNSTLRDATITEPVEGMITYLKDDNLLYKWTGSEWLNIAPDPDFSSLIPKSTVTTAGDLIIADGTSSVTRLPVGAADTVLTSNGITASWEPASGGGWTLLSTTNMSGSSSILVSSISQDYKDLRVEIAGATHAASGFSSSVSWFNGGSLLEGELGQFLNNATWSHANSNISLGPDYTLNTSPYWFELKISNYSQTNQNKAIFGTGWAFNSTPARRAFGFFGSVIDNRAVNRIQVQVTGTTYTAGVIRIWGAN